MLNTPDICDSGSVRMAKAQKESGDEEKVQNEEILPNWATLPPSSVKQELTLL